MKNYALTFAFCCCFYLFIPPSLIQGQNLESFFGGIKKRIDNKEWTNISGGINASSSFNSINGMERRSDPFSFRLSANLNFDFLGIKAPFSASISNGNKVYKLPPYAFYGISPSYKWIKLHLGDRSMEFSPYTLSGHNFYGTGIELSPGKFRFSAMYGKLKRAVAEDLNHKQNLDPAFDRKGWGIKGGYESDKGMIHLIVFQSKDDPYSIPPLQKTEELRPQENTVLGIQSKYSFGKVLNLSVDYGFSGLTRNLNSPDLESLNSNFVKTMGGLFQPKVSSGFYHAIKSSIGFNTKIGQIGINHERIDPGYKTLGALYFNNDVENFTASLSSSFFNKKVTFSGNGGLQRNNLKQAKNNTGKRFIGMLNVSFQANKRLNLNLALSNISSTNRLRAVTLPNLSVDSLILVQTNKSINFNYNYNLSKVKTIQSMISGMFSYQQANSIENETVNENQSTAYYLGTLSHLYTIQSIDLSINSSFLINYGQIPNINLLTYSPSISLSKKVLKEKVSLSASFSFSNVRNNGVTTNKILNIQTNAGMVFFEKHRLNLSFSLVNNDSEVSAQGYNKFREFNGNISYGWNF